MTSQNTELMLLFKKMTPEQKQEFVAHAKSVVSNDEVAPEKCPHCAVAKNFVKFGRKNNKQRYRCGACNRIFTARTGTALTYSHSSEKDWVEVITDTLEGVSLRKTAKRLDVSVGKVFSMRRLIINAIETYIEQSDLKLEGIVEVDDTYFLKSVKGTEIPATYYRKSRKRGAKIRKRGISKERVSVNVGVARGGSTYAKSVNLGKPSVNDVYDVFGHRIDGDAIVYCDGANGYLSAFSGLAAVQRANRTVSKVKGLHINTVNQAHTQLKQRIENIYHGVATKYLNKYSAMMAFMFKRFDKVNEQANFVLDLLKGVSRDYRIKIADLAEHNILDLGQLIA
jgi:transposase-like protein